MSTPLRARPLSGPGPVTMPRELDPRRLLRRTLQVAAALGLLVLIILLAPGLGEVRAKLEGADPAWIALAIAFELMSCTCYVLMFRPIFCSHMPWRTSWEISWSSLGMGSIVPASGAAGWRSAPGSCTRAACRPTTSRGVPLPSS